MRWRAPESRKKKQVYLSEGGPNAEGRFDTSAMSLTNSMTWIPPSTSVCRSSEMAKHVLENLTHAQYPVACLLSVCPKESSLKVGNGCRLSMNDAQVWMSTRNPSWPASSHQQPMENVAKNAKPLAR